MFTNPDEPLSVHTAALLSVALTLIFVAPIYLSRTTRPTPTLSRDAPSVIRARLSALSISCIVGSLMVLWIIVEKGNTSLAAALTLLGWWPAPVTEEIVFRSAIISLHILANLSPDKIVLVTPLYFGIGHIHHFYEFRLTNPDTPLLVALLGTLFHFTYATLFGCFVTFVYLRTGSVVAVILIHSFCNWCGLPRLWGHVEADPRFQVGKEGDRPLHVGWTVGYYLLLLLGAMSFGQLLWPLTESDHALVSFSSQS
ncbi:hypothetical protein N7468_000454 [Penicillium chermesinum]|uniref:intramembrane prenyl-peptidase Rce1 n=1 Tax=Penicillium chermesinum TaxID=63820 RepID=A0A9W9TYD3_9EURO|nr:uncharacterized protein N7468_000454 [Penicillium chermesinum]KAJ5249003.1 hypothetical protein N7468_000454 [Penicillium chermesinum]